MGKTLVLSFDYDGCLSVGGIKLDSHQSLYQYIATLLGPANARTYDKIELFIGSARQSYAINEAGIEQNKSCCFTDMPALKEHLQKLFPDITINLNPYLLSDTYGGQPHGTNFTNALNKDSTFPLVFTDSIYDKNKLSIIYAQIHKYASENPNEHFDFHFFDDRPDILDALFVFFNANKDLMPNNIPLYLHQYSNNTKTYSNMITGEGDIDFNYEENIHRMFNVIPDEIPESMLINAYDAIQFLKNNNYLHNNFKPERNTKSPNEQYNVEREKLNSVLKNTLERFISLADKARRFCSNIEAQFAHSTSLSGKIFLKNLVKQIHDYFQDPTSKKQLDVISFIRENNIFLLESLNDSLHDFFQTPSLAFVSKMILIQNHTKQNHNPVDINFINGVIDILIPLNENVENKCSVMNIVEEMLKENCFNIPDFMDKLSILSNNIPSITELQKHEYFKVLYSQYCFSHLPCPLPPEKFTQGIPTPA